MLKLCPPLFLVTALACSNSKDTATQSAKDETSTSLTTNSKLPAREASKASAENVGKEIGYGPDVLRFSELGQATKLLVERHPNTVVWAVGEYHKLISSNDVQPAIQRFTEGIFPTLSKAADAFVLESWTLAQGCGQKETALQKNLQKTIERPKDTESHLQTLMKAVTQQGLKGRLLTMECQEYAALSGNLPGSSSNDGSTIDPELLLKLVASKLGAAARDMQKSVAKEKGAVIVYGGSTHNDLTPYTGMEAWSYAPKLNAELDGKLVEIDLYVPELVRDDPVLKGEAWYPLLKDAKSDSILLIRRDDTSYILLLRIGRK